MAATCRGIDVSSYQSAQNWAALVRGGLTYAAAKASEGEHTHDPRYRMHMDGMRGAAVLPQAYHYAWPNQDARTEADNYLAAVRPDAEAVAGFVHFLDLERRTDGKNYAGMTAVGIRAYAEAWIDRVKAAHPRQRVGCYTSAADIAAGHYPRNSDFLFYPAYPAGPLNWTQAEQRARPNPGRPPLFWQFASSPTDRSICYMTPAAYRAWAGHQEDDVPLTDADVQKIVKGILDADSIPASRVLPNADAKTNHTWTVRYALQTAVESARRAQQAAEKATTQLAAQGAAVTALAAQLGKGRDVAAIVAAVQAAVDKAVPAALADQVIDVTVHDAIPPAPAKS